MLATKSPRYCNCWLVLLSSLVEFATDVVWRCYQLGSKMVVFFCYNYSAMLLKGDKLIFFYEISSEVSVTWICNLGILFLLQ
jgi:hypothetical protein